MTRIIRIETCSSCPNADHLGAYATVAYVPVCHVLNRELPYTLSLGAGGRHQATVTRTIPDWCPLEELPTTPTPTPPPPHYAFVAPDDSEGGLL